jgi:hypothetical protein
MRVGTLRNLWSRVRRSVRDQPRDQDFVTEMEDHVGRDRRGETVSLHRRRRELLRVDQRAAQFGG